MTIMMKNSKASQEVQNLLMKKKLIPVIRGANFLQAEELISACIAGGCRIIEMTYTNKDASRVIKGLAPTLCIGAGTILTVEMAKDAIESGAHFIVSPNINEAVADYCLQAGILYIPGCLTPTEIAIAAVRELSLVKLFPGSSVEMSYLKSMAGPFPNIKFMVTGGVGLDNFSGWLEAGASCLGIGGGLLENPSKIPQLLKKMQQEAEKYGR
ncbi:MAG: bifunctional 4-hydroxy-2-oxoglutarate aldolase/2-dehydro-3-deoxy-phosphogluconate aldolase [Culicoidibacterales bacterium]